MDCGLQTADCGQRIRVHTSLKTSSVHIVIFQRFLKLAIAKMKMSNSSSMPLTPPYCEAWPLRGWRTGGGGGEVKVTGMFVAFFRERNCTLRVFNIFNI